MFAFGGEFNRSMQHQIDTTIGGRSMVNLPFSLSALEHGAFVFAGLLIYVISTRLGQQRRYPSAAMAWVITITVFPYIGVPAFLLFGTRKFARPVRGSRISMPADSARAGPGWALHLLSALDVPPPALDSCIVFHEDGFESRRALLTLIEHAQQHVDLSTYVLGADKVGASVVDALVRRARDGVHVRILLDAIGNMRTSRKQIRALKDGGVSVCWFMPLLHNPLRGRTNLRYHRKLMVVDRCHLWSGGRNLASEYFIDEPGLPAWTDLSFVVRGSLAAQAQLLFERDWRAASGRANAVSPEEGPGARPEGGASAQLIPSGPDCADDTIYALLLSAAYQANRRIQAVTPYFVPDDALLSAWCMAARRGVRVTLIVPARSNHRLADLARERALRELAAAGASVHLYPAMIHAKAVVIDDQLALCGSANLDARSLFLNFELMTAFYGSAEISWLEAWIDRGAARSSAYQARAPSWGRDIVEGVVRSVGFQL